MNKKIEHVEKAYAKKDVPKFNVGDTIQIFLKIKEEDKTRIQMFEGVVISRRGSGISKSFTVRRISYGEGVERTFPLHSPNIERVKVVKKGKPGRAKLYYLRKKIGKKTKIEEKDSFGPAAPKPAPPREEGPKEGV